MKMLRNLLKKAKYIMGIGAVAAMFSVMIAPTHGLNATEPRFNFMQGDYELLRGANVSKGETVWKDPVSGEAGDEMAGIVFYHNGMLDTVARNTRIGVNIPAQITQNIANISASISADNAAQVTDTVVNGVVIGKSGLTYNLDQPSNLELVPGSVKWYPNSPNGIVVETPLPFGQSGNEIVSGQGLKIGDIKGCWEFSGFVTFKIKTSQKETPADLSVVKKVRNVSKNQSQFEKSTSAEQKEQVEFRVKVQNSGEKVAGDVVVNDVLPNELNYVAGSLKAKKANKDVKVDESIFANGYNFGDLLAGAVNGIEITFMAKTHNEIVTAKKVVNTAEARSGELEASDSAEVVLIAGEAEIVKSKKAYNLTQKIDATTRPAEPGDEIEYTLITKNNGNVAKDFQVEDGIADILEYADVISLSDNGQVVDGMVNTNESKMARFPIVNIKAGQEIVRTFTVKIVDPLPNNPANGYHYDDKLYNIYGNEVIICVKRPEEYIPQSEMIIEKKVRNVSRNELEYVDANTAHSGDVIEYIITFENIGDGPADYFKVYDVLPADVVLDPDSSAILGMGGEEHSVAEDITSGYIVVTLEPGAKGYIRFRVLVSVDLVGGKHLVNTAYIEDDGEKISDTAETVIMERVVITEAPKKELPKTGSCSLFVSGILATLGAVSRLRLKW